MTNAESRLTELEAFKLAAAGADKVQHRAQLLEREVSGLREENRVLKAEKAELVPRLEDAEGRAARHRFDVSQAAKAINLLVGLLTTGRDRFRVALLSLPQPPRVGKDVWQRLRGFLSGEDDDEGMPFERRRRGHEREEVRATAACRKRRWEVHGSWKNDRAGAANESCELAFTLATW